MTVMYQSPFQRHKTREVRVGAVVVGGDNPIWVQSMTTPDTHDVEATVAEIHRLEEAGCEIVRVTVPKAAGRRRPGRDQEAHPASRSSATSTSTTRWPWPPSIIPIDKIRINPGNIGGIRPLRQVIRKAKDKGMPDAHRRQRRQPGARVRR